MLILINTFIISMYYFYNQKNVLINGTGEMELTRHMENRSGISADLTSEHNF
jgi:hypothetical protein